MEAPLLVDQEVLMDLVLLNSYHEDGPSCNLCGRLHCSGDRRGPDPAARTKKRTAPAPQACPRAPGPGPRAHSLPRRPDTPFASGPCPGLPATGPQGCLLNHLGLSSVLTSLSRRVRRPYGRTLLRFPALFLALRTSGDESLLHRKTLP